MSAKSSSCPPALIADTARRLYSEAMRCPSCGHDDTRVVDSRAAEDGAAIRRRRSCAQCDHRFTTFERAEEAPLVVVKRSGERSPFDRSKIVRGLALSAKGRPVEPAVFEAIADSVEDHARLVGAEVSSEWIGIGVLERLRGVDEVAALRFASVYKGFNDAADFERELSLIKREQPPTDDPALIH